MKMSCFVKDNVIDKCKLVSKTQYDLGKENR